MKITLKQYKNHIIDALKNQYDKPEAESIATLLLEHFTGYNKIQQILNASEILKEEIVLSIKKSLDELIQNKPLQYILGETEFCGFRFIVQSGVLIPRQETELLVYKLVDELKNISQPKILDIGTGSGAIAISLSKLLPGANITATDISDIAIETANENAKNLQANINIVKHDIFSSLKQFTDKFDCIVSNPPYVTESEKKLMHPNVLNYEPHLALFVNDNNPLIYYKRLAETANQLLKPKGIIYCEINENLADETSKCFKAYEFDTIIFKDFHNKNRIIKGCKQL